MALKGFSFRGPNSSSGMGVSKDCRPTFLELQGKRTYRYILFKIDEKKREIVVEKTGDPTEGYENFIAALPENDCRYAVFDFDFLSAENVPKSKIFFIAWSPSAARVRPRMLYATSKESFKHELDGFHYEIQATDPTEIDLEVLKERAR